MVMTIVMTMVMTIVMAIVMPMKSQLGTIPFPKQQYTPEQRASETIVNSQK